MILPGRFSLLACGAAFLVHPLFGDSDAALAEPLVKAIAEICEKTVPSAKDYARIANSTVDFGRRNLQAGQRSQREVIESGLDAVDAGERLESKAADWNHLREELKNLLNHDGQQKPPPPAKDQTPNRDQNTQDQQSKEPSQEKDNSQSKNNADPQSDKSQKSGQPQEENEKSANRNPSSAQGGSETDDQPQKSDPKNMSSAFGDMKEPPTPPTPSDTPPETTPMQKVGGQSSKEAFNPGSDDPRLVIPLQKLDRLRDQDSPAKLFRMMEGSPSSNPGKKGKDW